jgi:hypothetical protein
MSQAGLHARHRMMRSLIRSLTQQGGLMQCAVVDRFRLDLYPAHPARERCGSWSGLQLPPHTVDHSRRIETRRVLPDPFASLAAVRLDDDTQRGADECCFAQTLQEGIGGTAHREGHLFCEFERRLEVEGALQIWRGHTGDDGAGIGTRCERAQTDAVRAQPIAYELLREGCEFAEPPHPEPGEEDREIGVAERGRGKRCEEIGGPPRGDREGISTCCTCRPFSREQAVGDAGSSACEPDLGEGIEQSASGKTLPSEEARGASGAYGDEGISTTSGQAACASRLRWPRATPAPRADAEHTITRPSWMIASGVAGSTRSHSGISRA